MLGIFKENNTEDTQTRKEFGTQDADFLRKVAFLEKVKIKKTYKNVFSLCQGLENDFVVLRHF